MDRITKRFVDKVKSDFDKGIVSQRSINAMKKRTYDGSEFYPYLDSDNGFVSRAAVSLVAKSGHAIHLVKCLDSSDEEFRVYVSCVMMQCLPDEVSDEDVESFMPYLEDSNETVRGNIVWIIKKLGRMEMLTHLLFDEDMNVVRRVQRWMKDSEKNDGG